MNGKKFKWILYIIILVIVSTIGIQVYWNYKNYQTNKQQLINDVQISLDNAVDGYFENLAKQQTNSLFISNTHRCDSICNHDALQTMLNSFSAITDTVSSFNLSESINVYQTESNDSIFTKVRHSKDRFSYGSLRKDSLWLDIPDSLNSNKPSLLNSILLQSLSE